MFLFLKLSKVKWGVKQLALGFPEWKAYRASSRGGIDSTVKDYIGWGVGWGSVVMSRIYSTWQTNCWKTKEGTHTWKSRTHWWQSCNTSQRGKTTQKSNQTHLLRKEMLNKPGDPWIMPEQQQQHYQQQCKQQQQQWHSWVVSKFYVFHYCIIFTTDSLQTDTLNHYVSDSLQQASPEANAPEVKQGMPYVCFCFLCFYIYIITFLHWFLHN